MGWVGNSGLKRPCLLACPGGKVARAQSCLPWSRAKVLENLPSLKKSCLPWRKSGPCTVLLALEQGRGAGKTGQVRKFLPALEERWSVPFFSGLTH